MFDIFKSRLEITGTLSTVTALRISAGRSTEPIGSDLPVIKDAVGRPLIPGSSFKGALRSRLESFLRGIDSKFAANPAIEEEWSITSEQMKILKAHFKNDAALRSATETPTRFGLGFAKSRGMGLVEVKLNSAIVQYPGCCVKDKQISQLGRQQQWPDHMLLGASAFLEPDECQSYGFPPDDARETPVAAQPMELGFGVQLSWRGAEQVQDLFMRAVQSWCQILEIKAV